MNFTKKFLSALIICAAIAPAAANAENADTYRLTQYKLPAGMSLYSEYDVSECVDYVLGEIQKNMPDRIDLSKFNLPALAADDLFYTIYQTIEYERPDLFYLSGVTGVYSIGDSMAYIDMATPVEVIVGEDPDTGEYITSFIDPYLISDKNEIKRRQKFIDKETEKIVSLTDDTMSDFDKVLTVHNYIANNYCYDNSLTIRTLDEMIINKTGVCQGYSYLLLHALKALDIPCVTVPSDAHNHMWNKVQLDGNWYNVDVTHDDNDIEFPIGQEPYSHFLLTDDEMRALSCASHIEWNDESVYIADNGKYSDSAIHQLNTAPAYNDGWYYFGGDKILYKADFNEPSSAPDAVYDGLKDINWQYIGSFSSVVSYGDKLYFNSPNSIYEYDPQTSEAKELEKYNFEQDNGLRPCLYGLYIKDYILYAGKGTDLNKDGVSEKIPVYLTSADINFQNRNKPVISLKNIDAKTLQNGDSVYVSEYKGQELVKTAKYSLKELNDEFTYDITDKNTTGIKVFVWSAELIPMSLSASQNRVMATQ